MAITPIYTSPLMSFPRSYIKGFVGSTGMSNLHFSGMHLVFDYLAPLIVVDMVIQPYFYPASSNVYTLDFVFDFAASQVYVSGSPVAAGVGIEFYPMTTEQNYFIRVLSTLTSDESVKLNLPALTNYWRPNT